MRFNVSFGKRFGFDRLTDEQKAVIERLARGEISEAEAEELLGADVRVFEWRIGDGAQSKEVHEPPAFAVKSTQSDAPDDPPVSPDEAKAREMIERIAREVDAETGG